MADFETVYTEEEIVACDGGKGPLGHPKVYLEVQAKGEVTCPYCSKHFIYGKQGDKQKAS